MEADKYEVLDIIGRGSFGIIRKVKRKSDGYIMCRKEISYLRMSPKEREQLQSELSILKGLRHPNIVAYYEREHIKSSSDLHIYMEYCDDGDLARKIRYMKTNNQMAEEDFVWSVFSQLVCGLYRCHNGQDPPEIGKSAIGLGSDVKPPKNKAATMILHRDLKPDNIFLGADSSVKLGDFGLSKIIASHDFASTYVGTPFYMSPEICAAEQYGWHSDIWALGCVAYELCAKEPPFNAKTHLELIQKIRSGKVKPLPSVYSKELQDVILHCLKVNPHTRPDTAQLLNMPMVKLKRKEIEMVELGKRMQAKLERAAKEIETANQEKELACRKSKEAEAILARSGNDESNIRQELENTVRREWEVKARLEIDRQVQQAVERLQKEWEARVEKRVAEELEAKQRATSSAATSVTSVDSAGSSDAAKEAALLKRSSTPNVEVARAEVSLADLSMESPTHKPKQASKRSRNTISRAHTMFEGSPIDIQMAGTTPAPPIGNLGLSPRRTGTKKSSSDLRRNIFAMASNSAGSSGTGSNSPGASGKDENDKLIDETEEDDYDDIMLPSPTRQAPVKDPFKALEERPGLKRQATAPSHKVMPGSSVFKRPASPAVFKENEPPQAHGRPGSKLPAPNQLSPSKLVRGRTLVELQQATVWDPERDEMPSPFLHKNGSRALMAGNLGGPGKSHLR